MVVELKKDTQDYLKRFNIEKGGRYIVYAIDSGSGKDEYYIMAKDLESGRLYEPLPYRADLFSIIDGTIPKDWGYFEDNSIKAKVRSFREWLSRDFALRAHDYDMEEYEFKVIQKYKTLYEGIWSGHLHKAE